MKKHTLKRTMLALSAGLLTVVMLTGCYPYRTGPTEVGVRTVKALVGPKGVQEEIYEPGATYFFVPFLTDWHTFDTRLQNLEMTASVSRGDRSSRDDLTFKTIDGNDISLDIIVSYRLDPKMAPYVLQHVATNDLELKENIVRTIARSKPRDIFGELMTEDFYVSQLRSAKAEEVRATLNEILNPYGVIVERVGTVDYRFNEAYQQAIEDKKVADQQVEKNISSANATREEYLKRVEEAKGDVAKMKARADGEFLRAKIEADAYYQRQSKLAEAIEVEGRTAAEGILKMNEALAGAGGEAMVKMAIAEALMNKRIMMLPIGGGGLDIRTTDINQLLQLYGLQSVAGQAKK